MLYRDSFEFFNGRSLCFYLLMSIKGKEDGLTKEIYESVSMAATTLCKFCEADYCNFCQVSKLNNDAYIEAYNAGLINEGEWNE